MSFLNDNVYEQMDWLSQAVEPFHCKINSIIASLPDEKIISYDEYVSQILSASFHTSVNKHTFMDSMVPSFTSLDAMEREVVAGCYDMVSSTPIELVSETKTIIGEIKLVKIKKCLEDKDIKNMMIYKSRLRLTVGQCLPQALIDIFNLFYPDKNSPTHKESKTPRLKLASLDIFLRDAIKDDKIKFRSYESFVQFMERVSSYLTLGDDRSLAEIYRILMMAKEERLIYEVK